MYILGTFSVAPNLFLQVYTVHCVVHGRCLPMVYGLLPRKTAAIYLKFLTVIKERMDLEIGYNPLTKEAEMFQPLQAITSDFEMAIIKAAIQVWGESLIIQLCYFHFKQSMWRKIQDLGLATIYKSDAQVRKFLKLPQVLALVPVRTSPICLRN